MAADPRQPRILVVEDEDNIAMALDFLITREGYAHDRVASGSDALPRIRATHPDLVLLDVMLPGISGYDVCHSVRLDPALADVKILMMTARGSVLERQRSRDLGADGFISKPFELKELRDHMRRMLHREG